MSAFSITAIDKLIQPSKASASMEDETKPPYSFYPPLYVTPPVEPRRFSSPSPSSPSLSPYVINFKWRNPVRSAGIHNHANEEVQHKDPSEIDQSAVKARKVCTPQGNSNHGEAATTRCTPGRNLGLEFGVSGYAENGAIVGDASETASGMAMIRGTCDKSETIVAQSIKAMTKLPLIDGTKSATGLEDSQITTPHTSTFEEFFDAPDAPLDDSASEDEVSASSLITWKLGNLTPRLQEEIARRIRAEEALTELQRRWNEMAKKCALIGLSMTSSEEDMKESRGESLQDLYKQFSQKLVIARLVGGAIASAAVRAAKDEELESMLAGKNREISRLCDKLQYVELVNREMSQRNQEAIELAQRRKWRRRRRQKWALGCFCSAVCLGSAGLLCYKLFPWDQAGAWSKSMNGLAKHEPISMESCSS